MNLDNLLVQIQNMQSRMAQMQQRADNLLSQQQQQEITETAFEELNTALEELHATNEELHRQNEALATAYQAREAERQRYQELFEFAPDGYLVTDKEGMIQEANQAAANLLNVSQPSLVGSYLNHYIPTSEHQAFCTKLNQLCQVDHVQEWELRLQPMNRECFEAAVTVGIGRNLAGNPVGLRWLIRDISERQAIQKEIYFQAKLLDVVEQAVIANDLDMNIIYWNNYATKLYGWSKSEAMNRNGIELLAPTSLVTEATQLCDEVIAGNSSITELQLRHKNGSTFPVQITASPIFDAEGNQIGVVGISYDITERKAAGFALQRLNQELENRVAERTAKLEQANQQLRNEIAERQWFEAALSQREQEFRNLVENAPDMIARFDKELRHIYVNPVVESITGLLPQDFIGKTYQELGIPKEIAGFWNKALKAVFETHSEHEIEFDFSTPRGLRSYQSRLVPEFAPNGTTETVLIIVRDITDRKRAELEAYNALIKERRLGELKSRFVAMTSHEFRTPLATIQSSAELLENYRQRLSEEKQQLHLRRIQTSVEQMILMLNDLLIMEEAEATKLEFQPTPLDLVKFCRNLVEELQLSAQNQNTIIFIHQGNCPEGNQEFSHSLPLLDEKLLRRIFSNLLSNALKYSPNNSTIKFNLTCINNQAVFQIQDWGIGIPPEDQIHLFEPFHRANNVGRIQGTGLGLAIVKQCVDLHKGEITVISAIGEGSTFTVTLPLCHTTM